MRPIFGLLFSLAFSSAQAETCPDYGDLNSGVRIQTGSGAYSDYFRLADGQVRVEQYGINGMRYRTLRYAHGALEIHWTDYDDTGSSPEYAVDFSYEFSSKIDRVEGGRFKGTQYEKSSDGQHYESGYQISFGPTESLAIGDCNYPFLTVTKRYTWAGDSDESVELYLSSLDLLLDFDPTSPSNLELLERGEIIFID